MPTLTKSPRKSVELAPVTRQPHHDSSDGLSSDGESSDGGSSIDYASGKEETKQSSEGFGGFSNAGTAARRGSSKDRPKKGRGGKKSRPGNLRGSTAPGPLKEVPPPTKEQQRLAESKEPLFRGDMAKVLFEENPWFAAKQRYVILHYDRLEYGSWSRKGKFRPRKGSPLVLNHLTEVEVHGPDDDYYFDGGTQVGRTFSPASHFARPVPPPPPQRTHAQSGGGH